MIRLADSFDPPLVRNAPSVLAMFKEANLFDAAHVSAHAPTHAPPHVPKPEPQPNPEPDAAVSSQNTEINLADWDALFHAITARLQACSGPASLEHLPEHMLGVTATLQVTVRECAASLNRLHAALVRERQQRL